MFLIGDSHAVAIKAAAIEREMFLPGGIIDDGRNLNIGFHEVIGGLIRFRKPEHEALFQGFLEEAAVGSFHEWSSPVLCLFGMNIHYLSREEVWKDFAIATEGKSGRHLSQAVIRASTKAMIDGALKFYEDVAATGCKVISALPPRRSPSGEPKSIPAVFRALEDVVMDLISATGATVVDHRHWSLSPDGLLKAEYASSDDDVRGSALFGRHLLDQILSHDLLSQQIKRSI